MKKIIFFLLTIPLIVSCENAQDFTNNSFNFASFEKGSYDLVVTLGSSATQSVLVAASTPSNSERVYTIEVDASSNITASSYTIPNTITISANQTVANLDILITDNLDVSGEILVLNISDDSFTVQPTTVNVSLFCPVQPPAPGTWTLKMQDVYADSWDGASITITIDGVSTDYSMSGADGAEIEKTFEISSGASSISVVYNEDSEYPEEHTFQLVTPDGNTVMSEGPFADDGVPVDLTENFNYCIF